MIDAAPTWLGLLSERPDDPFWVRTDGAVNRGDLRDAILQRADQLRRAGWSPGDRLALDPTPDVDTACLLVAALAAGLSVLLVPRREPATMKDSLVACARARGVETIEPRAIPGDRLPGTVWVRSSGSFGNPRWVIHTPDTLLAGAAAAAAHLDFGPGATWRVSLPFDHVGGLSLIFRALVGGGALTDDDHATHVSLVATQLRRRLAGGADLSHHRCVMLGGGPIPAALRRQAVQAAVPLVISYGLTETGAVTAASSLDENADTLCTDHFAGRPLLADSIRVVGGGNIQVGGPARCVATADNDGVAVATPSGWLATGDLGRIVNGDLFVTGRRDNVIVRGGEKLPAEELEAALLALPGVAEAVVVPVDDDEFGQRPVAFLRWRDGRERSAAAVGDDLAATIAGWKLPIAVWSLPEFAGLKPDRAALRRLAEELMRT